MVWLTPPQEDGQVQAQRIAQAVNEGANAILISCSDAGKVTGAINDAVARGVPVMTFDSDAPQSKRFAFYGVDDVKLGERIMAELAPLMGGKGKVAILAGNQNAPNLRKRVDGVKREAAKHPGIQIVDTFFHLETPQDAAAEVMRVHNAYPEIAAAGPWWAAGRCSPRRCSPTSIPRKVKIVAVDALPAQLPYVDKGLSPVLLAQPIYNWGKVSVETVIDKLHFKKQIPAYVPMDVPASPRRTWRLGRTAQATGASPTSRSSPDLRDAARFHRPLRARQQALPGRAGARGGVVRGGGRVLPRALRRERGGQEHAGQAAGGHPRAGRRADPAARAAGALRRARATRARRAWAWSTRSWPSPRT